jgi:hypothetical protein
MTIFEEVIFYMALAAVATGRSSTSYKFGAPVRRAILVVEDGEFGAPVRRAILVVEDGEAC